MSKPIQEWAGLKEQVRRGVNRMMSPGDIARVTGRPLRQIAKLVREVMEEQAEEIKAIESGPERNIAVARQNMKLELVQELSIKGYKRSAKKSPRRLGKTAYLQVTMQAIRAQNELLGLNAATRHEFKVPENTTIDVTDQRRLLADPTLRDLALQAELRRAELEEREHDRRVRSRGVWGQLELPETH